MRDELKKYNKKTVAVSGTFVRFGKKKGKKNTGTWTTILLKNIKFLDGRKACDHLWFVAKKELLKVDIKSSAIIQVEGVVSTYRRKDKSYDFGIEDYKSVKILNEGEDIVPAKKWHHGGYKYFKFITGQGTKWFRMKNKKIERVSFIYQGKSSFNEKIVSLTEGDERLVSYIEKCV